MWIVDFPPGTTEEEAARYEEPFKYIEKHVKPFRATARSGDATGVRWWIHQRPRPEMRAALPVHQRYLVTVSVSKHRLFAWLPTRTLADHKLFAFARDDDYFFGVLHSRIHELWSLANKSTHGDGSDGGRPVYNNTICFETFPLPWPPGKEPWGDALVEAIADAARELDQLRNGWLNPGPVDGHELPESELKKRTLTNLYNERPTWLANAHRKLDEAVFAAYGWEPDMGDGDVLGKLLALNFGRAADS
jgi:type II restriction/modification system DNA methylase subunit YeeA